MKTVLFCAGFLILGLQLSGQFSLYQDTTNKKGYMIVSGAMIVSGILLDRDKLKTGFQTFVRDRVDIATYTTDDYIQHAPIAALLATDLILKRNKADKERHIRHLLVSEGMTLGATLILKRALNRQRPNGGFLSFPSGHTSYAFASAGVLYHSLKNDYPFWAYGGYAMASFVGASRILRDKHWISDVLVGAGIGVLCSHLSYDLDIWDSKEKSLNKRNLLSKANLNVTPLGVSLRVQF